MDSILFFDYHATGEGRQIEIFYSKGERITDEQAMASWKAKHDPYFHVGLDIIRLEDIGGYPDIVKIIKVHTPYLFEFITAKNKPFAFKCDYKFYWNNA